MAADTDRLEISVEELNTAQEIIATITKIKPLTSLSFSINGEGLSALQETLRLVEWGIGKNKPKIKEAALEVISPLVDIDPGLPNNINLTEFELKAMEEVLALIARSISKHKDGAVTR